MVYIITGDVNTGKSTYLLSLFQKNNMGDGFYNRKLYSGSTYIGQEMVHLSTGNTSPFSYRSDHIPEQWDELFTYLDYSFSSSGLHFCKAIIRNIMESPLPAYIDEIGPVELQEQGLYHDFLELLQTKKDIYVVIRHRCLSEVLLKFKIDQYVTLTPHTASTL